MIKNNYQDLIKQKHNRNDVVTIFYNEENDNYEYVLITLGNPSSIKKYLPYSNGKAISIKLGKQPLWLLIDEKSGGLIAFRQSEGFKQFDDIKEEDFKLVEYIAQMM